MIRNTKIIGTGKYLPKRLVTSEQLEKDFNIESGWSVKNSGVHQRYFVDEDETVASMSAKSLTKALEAASLKFEDLDLLICACGSYDHPVPYTACLIQKELGKDDSGIACFDVDSTCLSFVTALDLASYLLLDTNRYKNIAIVSSEIPSKCINKEEIESATLLGDGSAAVIITQASKNEKSCILTSRMETYSEGAYYTVVKGGGMKYHPLETEFNDKMYMFHMEGREVLRLGNRKILPFVESLFKEVDFKIKDIDLLIPHQASQVALNIAKKAFELKPEQMMINIHKYGNCIGASMPLALCDAVEEGRIKRGDKCCLLGTAAGLQLGGIIFIY